VGLTGDGGERGGLVVVVVGLTAVVVGSVEGGPDGGVGVRGGG